MFETIDQMSSKLEQLYMPRIGSTALPAGSAPSSPKLENPETMGDLPVIEHEGDSDWGDD